MQRTARDVRQTAAAQADQLRRRLHDSTLQMLEYLATGGYGSLQEPTEYRIVARQAAAELRHAIEHHDPARPTSLRTALFADVGEAARRGHFDFVIESDERCATLVDSDVPQLVDATREALNNVVKHAHARFVRVRCQHDGDDTVRVSVEDDGIGLPPDIERRVRGIRSSIADRLDEVGGTAHLLSEGAGTTVVLRQPLPAR